MRWRVRTLMLREALLGAGLVALLVLEWVAQRPFGAPWWAAALWAVLLCVTVAVSRRRPLFALLVCGGLNLLVVLNQLVAPGAFPFAYTVALFVLSYRAGRRMAGCAPRWSPSVRSPPPHWWWPLRSASPAPPVWASPRPC